MKLTRATLDDKGQVLEDPGDLAAAASRALGRPVSLDVYALARMVRSEGPPEANARAHVAINDARRLGRSILDTVTASNMPGQTGRFGGQFAGGIVRRYSTAQDPFPEDVAAAERAIDEDRRGVDLTEGATKFYDDHSQQYGVRTIDRLRHDWAPLCPFNVDGCRPTFYVWRKPA